jgi:antitoxin ParD1/3/4
MSRNTSVILGDHFDDFIKKEIESGRYKSASEVIRSGLRILEEESHKIGLINEALIIGEKSGNPLPFNNEKFKNRMKKKLKTNA